MVLKIAVNRNTGGFSIPDKYVDYLLTCDGWYLTEWSSPDETTDGTLQYMLPGDIDNTYLGSLIGTITPGKRKVIYRTHPDLIEAVERFGPYQSCELIEVPDNIEVYIVESESGYETVHEVHRSW